MDAAMIRSKIQCPFCFAIPTNKKFFSCKSSHKICEHCFGRLASLVPVKPSKNPARVKCPQGDCDYNDPPFRNIEIEEMIKNYDLEVNCKYYHDGCMFTGSREQGPWSDMAEHEPRCGCREVPCPNSECTVRVQLRKLLGHIQESHKDAVVKEDGGEELTLTCLLKEQFQRQEVSTWITIIWNHRNGQTFFPMFEKRGGAWYAWIFLQGIQEEAARWEGVVRVREPGDRALLEFRGPIYPIDVTGHQVMTKGKCLAMSDQQVEMMMSNGGLKDEERGRGFNSKIAVSYEVHLIEDDASLT